VRRDFCFLYKVFINKNESDHFVSVIDCPYINFFLFYVLPRRNNFSLNWWWAYNILICINMAIFYFVAGK